jgi:ribose/xylose/arabinose/galactoside ABC-type transport system permease subunit
MLPPQIVAPLFPAVLVALCRPRGHRLVFGCGLFLMYEYLVCVVFGSNLLVNFTMLSVLYGPHAVLTGGVQIVRGRHFIEMSNGDKYEGLAFAFWIAADLAMLATTFLATRRFGKWAYARFALVRRIVARFKEAASAKPVAR